MAKAPRTQQECLEQTIPNFLVPCAGGYSLSIQGQQAQTLTATSPLGAALIGMEEGEEVKVLAPHGDQTHCILAIA